MISVTLLEISRFYFEYDARGIAQRTAKDEYDARGIAQRTAKDEYDARGIAQRTAKVGRNNHHVDRAF